MSRGRVDLSATQSARIWRRKGSITSLRSARRLSQQDLPRSQVVALGDFAAADWDAALSGVDAIVHLAGRAHVVSGRDADPTPHVVANVHVTRRLLDAAVQAGVRRVVFASTVKIYGETTRQGRPFRAGDPPHPSDAYARSKAEAENVLWQVCRDSGMEGVVLRLPLTYGPGVKGNFLLLLEAIAKGRRLPFAGVVQSPQSRFTSATR